MNSGGETDCAGLWYNAQLNSDEGEKMNAEATLKLSEMAARIREMCEIIGYSVEQMAEKTEVACGSTRSAASTSSPV